MANKKNKKIINEPVPAEKTELSESVETEFLTEKPFEEETVSTADEWDNTEETEFFDSSAETEEGDDREDVVLREAEEAAAGRENTENSLSAPYLFRLVLVLTCICTVIAGLLAAVNALTKDVIQENQAAAKQEAILAVFPDGDQAEEYITDSGETVYIVLRENEIIGYTVNVTAGGYVGPVEMMIGMTPSGAVNGIKIISMEETPGVGTKISSESFLAQFRGMDSEVVFSENADAITGASFSSRAVEEAVNTALALEVDLADAAAELNAALPSPDGQISDFQDANDDNGDSQIEIGEAVVEGDDLIETESMETEPAETEPVAELPVTEPEPVAETEPEVPAEPEIPAVVEPEIPPETEPEVPAEPEIPVVVEPEIPPETEPELPAEPEIPVVAEPEIPPETEPEVPAEPEIPAAEEPEIPAETEPEVPAELEIPAEPELPADSEQPADAEEQVPEDLPEISGDELPEEPDESFEEETEPPIIVDVEISDFEDTEEPENTEEPNESDKAEEEIRESSSSGKGGFRFN